MAAPRKKRSQTREPVTKQDLRENNPSIADAVTRKLAPYKNVALTITALAGAGYILSQVYFSVGGRSWVTDYTLDQAIGNVKTEVNTKIETTKDTVLKNQDSIKTEITGTLNSVNKTLSDIARSQNSAAMDQAEVQMRLAFTQKQALQSQLSVVNQALIKDPNDQLALTRKMQIDDAMRQNDQYMRDAQEKMLKLRNGGTRP